MFTQHFGQVDLIAETERDFRTGKKNILLKKEVADPDSHSTEVWCP